MPMTQGNNFPFFVYLFNILLVLVWHCNSSYNRKQGFLYLSEYMELSSFPVGGVLF